MQRTRLARFGLLLAAVSVGAALAGLGLLVGRPDSVATGASVAEPALPAPPFVAEGETIIGNAAFVPIAISSEGSALVLDFELESLAPGGLASAPERFELVTTDGRTFTASVATELGRSVRFEGAADATPAQIAVTTWRLSVPLRYDTGIPLSSEIVLADGTGIQVQRVLEQNVGAQVHFEASRGRYHGYGSGFVGPLLIVDNGRWVDVTNVGGGFGTPSLEFVIEPLPDPLPVQVFAAPWIPTDERIVVFEGAGNE